MTLRRLASCLALLLPLLASACADGGDGTVTPRLNGRAGFYTGVGAGVSSR